jgi:hypothetical protein
MTRSVRGGTQIRKDMLGGYVDSWVGFWCWRSADCKNTTADRSVMVVERGYVGVLISDGRCLRR